MLVGCFEDGAKVFVFRGDATMPGAFFVRAMNAWFVRYGSAVYRTVTALLR